jgi:hypothetical protein
MNRPAAPSDFTIDVENVGTFIFGRRTRRDNFRIAAEHHRLTEGTDPAGTDFALAAEAQSTLSVLIVSAPAGFSKLLELDSEIPVDEDDSMKVVRAFMALRKKELSFRPGSGEEGKGPGEADGRGDGVLVSPAVQPAAN